MSHGARTTGLTLIELLFVTVVLATLTGGMATALLGIQGTVTRSQLVSELSLRVEHAMERIVDTAREAVTVDSEFSPLSPTSGIGSRGIQFRQIQGFSAGTPVYDDTLRVFIYGPDTALAPNQGLIIGRGTSLGAIHSGGQGPDGVLGTRDDDAQFSMGSSVPAVELLIPGYFAPSAGDMLTIDFDPNGRLLTITIRANKQMADGQYVLDQDLVLTERLTLFR